MSGTETSDADKDYLSSEAGSPTLTPAQTAYLRSLPKSAISLVALDEPDATGS